MTQPHETEQSTRGRSPRLLVGLDVHDPSNDALVEALSIALLVPRTRVDVVWVPPLAHIPLEPAEMSSEPKPATRLQERVQTVVQQYGSSLRAAQTEVRLHISEGRPSQAISEVAFLAESDMIIVGACEKHAVEKLLLGSTAKKLTAEAPCPVLVVRPRLTEAAPAVEKRPQAERARRRIGLPKASSETSPYVRHRDDNSLSMSLTHQ